MKYSIVKDFTDLSYWLVDRNYERATETKIFESDSMHECFSWFDAKSWKNENFKHLNVELENENVWCIYWSDFDENYYTCPYKGDSTLDDVCFRGSEKECDEFFQKHFIKNQIMEERTNWTILYLFDPSIKDVNERLEKEEVVGYFDSCRDARRWLDRNAERQYNEEVYDNYERFIYKDGKKYNYSFLEWSVSIKDKEKGLYKGKIIKKLM